MWTTDEPSDSYVEFGFDSTFGEAGAVIVDEDTLYLPTYSKSLSEDEEEHKITLTNLLVDTLYYYRIASVDIEENGPTYSKWDTFRTAEEPDINSPDVDSVRIVSVSDKSVTIQWTSDELSDSFVKYDSTKAVDKKVALRKAGHYVEDLFDDVVGSAKDVFEHSVTLTDLEPGVEYTFQAGCLDKSENEWESSLMKVATSETPDVTPPAAPLNLTTVAGSKEVMLLWDKNTESDAAGYNIYKLVDDEFVEIFSQVADSFFVDKSLTNDSTYYYKITAIDNQSPSNESDFSDEKLAVPKASAVPTAPQILTPADDAVVNTLQPTLTIYNSESIRDGLSYSFIVSTDSTFNTNIVVFQTGVSEGVDQTLYTVTSALADKTKYYWRSRAFDGYFYSEWMDRGSFNVDYVTSVELISFSGRETQGIVKLEWETASETNNVGFHILKGSQKDGEFVKINEHIIKPSAEGKYVFADKEVKAGKTYYYILQSEDVYGEKISYETISVNVMAPREYALYQNYPNPFNPVTTVKFDLPNPDRVILKIYNVLGQEIKTITDMQIGAGSHTVKWDGTNNAGLKVASGIYIYYLRAGKFVKAKKMTFIK